MRQIHMKTAMAALLAAFLAAQVSASEPAPEIKRPPGGNPQPVGQLHTLRTIPEACVRLEGQFTGDPATPYRIDAVRLTTCAQRAVYVDVAAAQPAPAVAKGWILNDRISVARADLASCVAVVDIWRKPGTAAPPALDAQGRSRIYLDKPQAPVLAPLFTAELRSAKGCR